MKVLALDIATRTGVAVGDSSAAPRLWSVDLGKGADEQRFSKIISITSSILKEHTPDLVAVEAPIGGREASAYLIGLEACVRGVCALRGVPCKPVHLGSVRKHFLGMAYTTRDFPALSKPKAKLAIKQLVTDRCRLLGWEVSGHDESDAAAVWDYACAKWSREYQAKPLGGLFHG